VNDKPFIVSLNFAVSGDPADIVELAAELARASVETLALERNYRGITEDDDGVRFLGASVLKTVAMP
jgi:hypothetical protein